MLPRQVTFETSSASMAVQLSALTAQVSELLEEMRALRRENADLRRQLAAAQGVQQHQPYAISTAPHIPIRPYSPEGPGPAGRIRTAGELSPEPSTGAAVNTTDADVVMSSPPTAVDPKRARRSLGDELSAVSTGTPSMGTEPVSTLGLPQGHGL